MKLLVDESLARRVVTMLRVIGEELAADKTKSIPVWDDVTYVRDVAPGRSDDEILAWARAHDHVIVTHDKAHFGERLVRQGARGPSIIVVRDAPRPMEQCIALFRWLPKIDEDLRTGAIVVVSPEARRWCADCR
jgi:predicted nuclease of predicted toxin-antitoxin system